MLNFLRKIIPQPVFKVYHFALANLANLFYGFPSKKLIVIGVTGTNGKSTTVNLIAKVLEQAGHKVGFCTTVNFKVGEREWLNKSKMTMLGRFQLQRLLRQMVRAGCGFVVIETSSQGLIQYRHLGVEYDVAIFTNLTPEHIEAHHGFENYKKAKAQLFSHLTRFPNKIIGGKKIPKIIAVNADDEHVDYFLEFKADKKITFSIDKPSDYRAEQVEILPDGARFKVRGQDFQTKLLARFNVYNALAALAACGAFGVDLVSASRALAKIKNIPGRLEYIDQGQDFKVMVDYAPEPESLRQLYNFLNSISKNKLIHVLGSAGGGRDKSRRPILGRLAGKRADYVIITNEDPYDEDPNGIIDQVAVGALGAGKILEKDLFKILDRRAAIKKAIDLAQADDFVLVTGKGAEQAMVVEGGRKVAWDDREVVREIIKEKLGAET
ncbi:UDP-N-acetylmuramoyl-L-alanyl-D-glutamate--2,6-diaminopimelate ligase [Patescibacteria group bacterium]|nr:UDP-N-acetylmuramoyl-L-alanyl-D-glutamate--2,6-diaminopimelate ligase [Patescibacteria group bacterium]MBU1922231.1 UDP-N-acetylmuramoyl-L-alanyl-D-glutamate--2,6-diaminopimelate ligase [Patescibacteria group bacterium]